MENDFYSTYPLDPLKKWSVVGIVFISTTFFTYIFFFAGIPKSESDIYTILCLLSWLVPLNLIALIIPFRIRLTLSTEGLTYSCLGSHFIKWENIDGAMITPLRTITLTLNDDFVSKPKIFGRTNEMLGMKRKLPLMYFRWQWSNGGLQEDFRQFAPQLFGEDANISFVE